MPGDGEAVERGVGGICGGAEVPDLLLLCGVSFTVKFWEMMR